MTRISHFPLTKKVQEKILGSFTQLISELKKKEDIDLFLDDFLTPVEQIMLAKRLAIAFMVEKGFNYSEIRSSLRVSTSTINHIQSLLTKGGKGYHIAINKLARNEVMNEFWHELDEVLIFIAKGKRHITRHS